MRTRRRRLECDSLETRALLSGFSRHVGARLPARLMGARMADVAPPMAAPAAATSPVTGGGLVSVPNAPVDSDVTALQSIASGNNLVLFLTQFEALSGSDPSTQQTALSILNDSRNIDMALNGFAGGVAVTVPVNVVGTDQFLAQQMIAAAKAGDVDQAYSSLIVQAEASLAGQLQQMATGAQDASFRAFAASVLPTVQADLAAAQGTGTLAPVGTTPSSATLDSGDLDTLSTYYAINIMERFLGQMTLLVTNRQPIGLYAAKLIGDHEGGALFLGSYAASTGTYLPASIPAADAPMADSLVAALRTTRPRNTSRYDSLYIREMIAGHTQALQFTDQVLATSQNPVLKQFAVNVQPTINMHRLAAKALRCRFG